MAYLLILICLFTVKITQIASQIAMGIKRKLKAKILINLCTRLCAFAKRFGEARPDGQIRGFE
jgi:hypothetical protein